MKTLFMPVKKKAEIILCPSCKFPLSMVVSPTMRLMGYKCPNESCRENIVPVERAMSGEKLERLREDPNKVEIQTPDSVIKPKV